MKKEKKFVTVRYEVESAKIEKNSFVIAMISDLHNVSIGEKNHLLLKAIAGERPDIIVIAGDLVLGRPGAELKTAYDFLAGAVKIAPVFYALGNHEQRMKSFTEVYGEDYLLYEEKAKKLGVRFLENRTEELEIKGEKVCITGLALPCDYYDKRKRKELKENELEQMIGRVRKDRFHILLAHNPRLAEKYAQWGADLTFSGHYHGGMVKIPFFGGVISPDFRLFPSYSYGQFAWGEKNLIVGAGLGEHTIPLRIRNPRELVIVKCKSER